MYKSKIGSRIIPNLPGVPKSTISNGSVSSTGTSTAALLPLKNMSFVLSGKQINKENIKAK